MTDQTKRISWMRGGRFSRSLFSLLAPFSPANADDGKTFVMKLSIATVNDHQHEWLKRFAAAVEKDSGEPRIKAEIYPASQLGSIPRLVEGVRIRIDPGVERTAGIPCRCRWAL